MLKVHTNYSIVIFFKKIWRTLVLFYGLTNTPILDPLLACFITCMLWNPQITSSVKSVDLLPTNMVTEPFQSTYLNTRISGTWVQDLLCHYLKVYDKVDVLMN